MDPGGVKPPETSGVDWQAAARAVQVLVRARTGEELLERALDAAIGGCGAAAAAVWQYQGGRLSLGAERGLRSDAPADQRPRWTDLFKLPLNSGGQLLGVLEAYTVAPEGFGDDPRVALQMLGATLAGCLHRAQAADEAAAARQAAADQERLQDLELLWKLTRATSQAVSYSSLFESLLTALSDVLPYDAAALLTAAPVAECYVALHHRGHRGVLDDLVRRSAAAFAAFGGDPIEVDPAAIRPVSDGPDGPPASLGAGFAVPLTQDDEPVAVLYVGTLDPGSVTEQQVRVLNRFADHASASLARVRRLLAVELERLETIIQSLPQGVVLLDAAGQVLLTNPGGREHLLLLGSDGGQVDRLGGRPLGDWVQRAIATGCDLVRDELELRRAERTWHLAVTVVPVREAGQLYGVVLSIEDVSEIRQTEQRLFHDARLASIGEFASGLAHELNNPMMIILGIAEVMAEDESIAEEKRALLRDMETASLRAAEIVKQLMVFADTQRDSGWDTLRLPDVLGQAVGLVVSQVEWDGAEVRMDVPEDLPPVQGNAGKLQQLALSLVRNAYEAILHSGRGGVIQIRARAAGGQVLLEVQDDGPGVPAELQDKIFDVFFTTKRDYQGKGLGLSVAHRIAQEHNGSLTVEDAPGGGALFRLALPASHFGSG